MRVIWCVCGSFCTIAENLAVMERLAHECEVIPVVSERTASTDTRFGKADDILKRISDICGREPILTVADAEPIGPVMKPDICIAAPVTGNTLAKLAHGITDSAVTMAVKSTLRREKPILLSPATNDAMGANFPNIGTLSQRKHFYFVPMKQDDPTGKPTSLVADTSQLYDAVYAALDGRQLRPLFV
nr:dipicolinate synthase subunit B [Clostridia bacterium]